MVLAMAVKHCLLPVLSSQPESYTTLYTECVVLSVEHEAVLLPLVNGAQTWIGPDRAGVAVVLSDTSVSSNQLIFPQQNCQ